MWNQIPHPTSSLDWNLSKNTGRYVKNSNTKSSFFLSSSKINQYYFIIFLRRPILDPKIPLMLTRLTSLRKTQNNIILYLGGFNWLDLQWSFYLMTVWWTNTIVTSLWRNKTSSMGYISKIHLEYSSMLQYFNNPTSKSL